MARPCSPSIVGPVSEWSATVYVQACVPGAQVTVLSLTRSPPGVVAVGTASDGAARLPLSAGVKLRQDDRLIAVQRVGAEDSLPPSDVLALPVGAAPTSSAGLPSPAFASHLWECGRAVQVLGAVPGADIEVTSAAGLLGRATAHEGLARVALAGGLPMVAGTTVAAEREVVAEERAPTGFAFVANPPLRTTGTVNPLPGSASAGLPKPTAPQDPPAAGCDPAVLVAGVVDGATVTVISTRDGIPDARPFDRDQLWFELARPLDPQGEKLEITQSMPGCDRPVSAPLLVLADAATTPAAPVFVAPCPGSERIAVSGLLGGADLTLEISSDQGGEHHSEQYDAGRVAADSTNADLRIPPVPPGATITVTQQRCGLVASATETAQELAAVGDPDLGDEPIECALKVRVVSATPGALLEIRAQRYGVPSAPVRTISRQVAATSPVMHLEVAPALSAQDDIWVAQLTCTAPWTEGPHHKVGAVPVLDPPELLFPPVIGEAFVRVAAKPGAVVEVFRWAERGVHGFLGFGPVDQDQDRVPIYRPFLEGEQVVLLQRFCSHFSALGPPSQSAVPGSRVFALPPGQTLQFLSPGGHDVRISAVTMTCRVDGTWSCTAHAQNNQPDGLCDFFLRFVAKDGQGVIFDKLLEGAVIPPGSGLFNALGDPLPSDRHITWPWKPLHPPLQLEFGDTATWLRLLGSQGTFQFEIATWETWQIENVTPELLEDQVPPA